MINSRQIIRPFVGESYSAFSGTMQDGKLTAGQITIVDNDTKALAVGGTTSSFFFAQYKLDTDFTGTSSRDTFSTSEPLDYRDILDYRYEPFTSQAPRAYLLTIGSTPLFDTYYEIKYEVNQDSDYRANEQFLQSSLVLAASPPATTADIIAANINASDLFDFWAVGPTVFPAPSRTGVPAYTTRAAFLTGEGLPASGIPAGGIILITRDRAIYHTTITLKQPNDSSQPSWGPLDTIAVLVGTNAAPPPGGTYKWNESPGNGTFRIVSQRERFSLGYKGIGQTNYNIMTDQYIQPTIYAQPTVYNLPGSGLTTGGYATFTLFEKRKTYYSDIQTNNSVKTHIIYLRQGATSAAFKTLLEGVIRVSGPGNIQPYASM